MNQFEKYSQQKSPLNKIPQLPEIQPDKNVEPLSKSQVKTNLKRINEIEGNLKLIERQYKSNLKEGFENKIKSFRLQAVMERKVLKQTIESAKKNLEDSDLKDKIRRASNIKKKQIQAIKYVSQRKQEKSQKAHSYIHNQKRQLTARKDEQKITIEEQNKLSHDKICKDFDNRHIKKLYLQSIRKQKQKKQEEEIKKNTLQQLISNKETLEKLKEELSQINQPHTKDLFVTI